MPLAKQLAKSSLYAPKSLLDIWYQRSAPRERKPEFHGRVTADGPRAKLYPNLKEGQSREGRGEPVVEAWDIGLFELLRVYIYSIVDLIKLNRISGEILSFG